MGWHKLGILWIYVWICLLADIAGYFLHEARIPHFWLSNLFFLLEYACFWIFFMASLAGAREKRMASIMGIVIGFYFLVTAIYNNPLKSNYDNAAVLYAIYVVLSMLALYKVIEAIEHTRIERSPLFVFSASLLLYSAGSLFIFLFKNKLTVTFNEFMGIVWMVRNLLNILKNCAIARYFVLQKSLPTS
jgi:hypothetical protein